MIAFDKYEMRRVYWDVKEKARQRNRQELLPAGRPLCRRHPAGFQAFLGGQLGRLRKGNTIYTGKLDGQPDANGVWSTWSKGRQGCGSLPVLSGLSVSEPIADGQLSVSLPGAVLTPVVKIWEVQLQKRYLLWKSCSVFLERQMTGDNIQLNINTQAHGLGRLMKFQVWLVKLGLLQRLGSFLQKRHSRESGLKISGIFNWT